MSTVIDFKTRLPLASAQQYADFEILGPGQDEETDRVLVEGLIPAKLARRIQKLCAAHNARLER